MTVARPAVQTLGDDAMSSDKVEQTGTGGFSAGPWNQGPLSTIEECGGTDH